MMWRYTCLIEIKSEMSEISCRMRNFTGLSHFWAIHEPESNLIPLLDSLT